MKKLTVSKFDGGISLLDPTVIKDNQFEKLQNFYYNSSGRVQSRRGYKKYGGLVGDGTKPVTSYFFFQRDDTNATLAICFSGTKMYKFVEATLTWLEVGTGYTEYETAVGMTSNRTRWSFLVYKNIIYMCNGVDQYQSYNGTVITKYAAMPKVRYLLMITDRLFGAGEDLNPSTVYYTNAAPADGAVFNTNAVVVGGDEQGRINSLFGAGQVILAGKDTKIYNINVSNNTAVPIDAQNGAYANRSIWNVGNGILYFNEDGINNLQARPALTGGSAMATQSYSADLQPLIEQIQPKHYNSGCAYYVDLLKNYYFSFDTSGDNIPDTTIVFSALVVDKAWSTYTLPIAYQYGTYIESGGDVKFLIASAATGQMYEFETGFNDDGGIIDADLLTKRYDFGSPDIWKDFQYATIFGLCSEGGTIYVEILIDETVVQSTTIADGFIDVTQDAFPIGTTVIGTGSLGGGGSPTINTYPYKIKIPLLGSGGGQKIQIHMYSNMADIVWTLDKISVEFDNNTEDIFPTANIA